LAEFNSARTTTLAACGENSQKQNWRREGFLNPFCHLVFKAVRYDSPPCDSNGEMLKRALSDAQLRLGLTRPQFAAKLNITVVTLANWERGRTKPARRLWKAVCRIPEP
jgi:DNA-binding XRE family transcriptional regulator